MPLDPNQIAVLETLLESGALKFGDFTLKSGRKSAYFMNVGCVDSGSRMARLAACYATALEGDPFGPFDLIYGPAYKGIPLAVAIAISLFERTGRDVGWAFDRKEAKDHGEGGVFVGAPLAGQRIVIVDDVMTAGTSVRESFAKLAPVADTKVVGVMLAVDREEPGPGGSGLMATRAIEEDFGVPVRTLVKISEAVDHLHGREIAGKIHITNELRTAIDASRRSQ